MDYTYKARKYKLPGESFMAYKLLTNYLVFVYINGVFESQVKQLRLTFLTKATPSNE